MLVRLFMALGAVGIPRLTMKLLMDGRVPLGLKLVLPAALVYVISPIDLLPDMLTPFGRIDDIIAVGIALAVFIGLSPRQVVLEHIQTVRSGRPAPRADSRADPEVVEGKYRFVEDPDDLRNHSQDQ